MPNQAPPSLPERIVGFIEASSAMAEKAASAELAQQQHEKRAEALIPGIVDTLLAIKVDSKDGPVPILEADEKAACAAALKDPEKALQILTKVAAHFKKSQADRLGQGDPDRREKKAGAGESPYAGRRTSQEPPSWQNFRRQIMGAGG